MTRRATRKKFRTALDTGFFRADLRRLLPDGLDEILEEIDVVVVVLALQHCRDTLETHAGVDRGSRQRLTRSPDRVAQTA